MGFMRRRMAASGITGFGMAVMEQGVFGCIKKMGFTVCWWMISVCVMWDVNMGRWMSDERYF